MKKLLVICGLTATGKTSLAFKLAKSFNGELVSADSRQLYKKMDVGTGKEWGEVPIHGYDLAEPGENFSVSQYVAFTQKVIKKIYSRNKLPILVGGTGLYIKAVVDGISTVDIPKNEDLRKTLTEKNILELFEQLATLDSAKAASLNSSDKQNPRRLVRAIEVAIWKMENGSKHLSVVYEKQRYDTLFIGLKADSNLLDKRIGDRVEMRMNNGFIDEVEDLLKSGVSWKNQSMKSIGYRESEKFLKSGLGYEDFIVEWIKSEKQYVKRQYTWFRKDTRINWFDISEQDYYKNVEILVKKWLNRS
ncbi:MAG: tRNA dimethylallyltransferase [Parcubacteria group bacterium GW2011_GWA1_38_7]|nr:MAG: tRNA dimethylallyltransferase [Parcubacteria group bacterium GW2011_GWA1_38_7]